LRFNAKNKQETSTTKSSIANILIDKERLSPIDVLTIDKNSRLTLTKKVKKIIPLNTNNKIIVFQDTLTKNILLKVQHEETIIDSWILTKSNDNANNINNNSSSSSSSSSSSKIKTDNIRGLDGTIDDPYVNEIEENEEYNFNIDNRRDSPYNTIYKQKTLYNIPILLVDDENDLLTSFNLLLKIEGYRNIKTFSDSKSVLKHLSDKDPLYYKLAITDIRMPDINGIQLYQILKILNPSIKIIFLTALDAVNELASIYPEIKPSDIMKKPIDPELFIKTVNDKVNSIGIKTL
jgi:CheY-like chemotaxis protein